MDHTPNPMNEYARTTTDVIDRYAFDPELAKYLLNSLQSVEMPRPLSRIDWALVASCFLLQGLSGDLRESHNPEMLAVQLKALRLILPTLSPEGPTPTLVLAIASALTETLMGQAEAVELELASAREVAL